MIEDDLKGFTMLGELGDSERASIAEFLTESSIEAGSLLFQEREEADEMYFVVDGSLRIESRGRVLGQLGAGEVLGVVSLIQISRRECDAMAQDDCRLLVLSREGYLRLRADQPAAALALQEGILRSFAGYVRMAVADRRGSDGRAA